MTGLVRLLAAILGAHIQRDDLPPAELVWPDERLFAFGNAVDRQQRETAAAEAMYAEIDRQRTEATRPCWACGDPVGFHAKHWPCWDVPPFVRTVVPTMTTYGNGSLM